MEFFYIKHKPTGRYYKGGCLDFWISTTKNLKPLTLRQVKNFYKYAIRDGVVKMWYNPSDDIILCKEDEFEVIDMFTNQVVDCKKFK